MLQRIQETNWEKVTTGWMYLDYFLGGGMKASTLTSFIASGKVGKTYFITNWVYRLIREQIPVYFFSAEMGAGVTAARMMQLMYQKSWRQIEEDFNTRNYDPYCGGIDYLEKFCVIDPTSPLPVEYVASQIQKFSGQCKYFFIDHHMKMTIENKRGIYDEITGIMNTLYQVSQQVNSRIVVVIQARRQTGSRVPAGSVMPQMSHGKGSGSIELNADAVITMCNPGLFLEECDLDKKDGIFVQLRPGRYHIGAPPPVFIPYNKATSELIEVKRIF